MIKENDNKDLQEDLKIEKEKLSVISKVRKFFSFSSSDIKTAIEKKMGATTFPGIIASCIAALIVALFTKGISSLFKIIEESAKALAKTEYSKTITTDSITPSIVNVILELSMIIILVFATYPIIRELTKGVSLILKKLFNRNKDSWNIVRAVVSLLLLAVPVIAYINLTDNNNVISILAVGGLSLSIGAIMDSILWIYINKNVEFALYTNKNVFIFSTNANWAKLISGLLIVYSCLLYSIELITSDTLIAITYNIIMLTILSLIINSISGVVALVNIISIVINRKRRVEVISTDSSKFVEPIKEDNAQTEVVSKSRKKLSTALKERNNK